MQNGIDQLVAQIAAAYFSSSQVDPSMVSKVLIDIRKGLTQPLEADNDEGESIAEDSHHLPPARRLTPHEIKKSLADQDWILCFEDNKKYKTLKRTLFTKWGLTPDQYRARWGLPTNYPMVAINYSDARKAMAHKMGLGVRAA